MNPAVVSVPPEDVFGDNRWVCMHKRYLAEAKEKEPDVVFIGDFVVAMAAQMEVWEKLFISLHCLNFGIVEDKTQHVLWRIENGEIGTVNPQVVVLAVGANNHQETVEEIADGIKACVQAILNREPSAQLVVLKLLPCGQNPNPLRDKFNQVNALLETNYYSDTHVHLMSVDPGFVNTDGTISHHDMFDYAHLTRQAYMRAFEPLAEFLQELLGLQVDVDDAQSLEQLP